MTSELNLDAYLSRIGYTGARAPSLECLRALHLAHGSTIPFENLDIQMGLPIKLDLASLHEKLVRRRRGGYCFEQNTLFMAALRAFEFEPKPCEARVRYGMPAVLPRTHMLLLVDVDGVEYLCDVGFGGEGLLHPLPTDGEAHEQFSNTYRVVAEGALRVLQSLHADGWFDLYAFIPEERNAVDFEMGNWYTSAYPQSRFVLTLTAQLPTPEARYTLRNRTYTVIRNRVETTRELDDAELWKVLRDVFTLDVPDGTSFRAINPSSFDAPNS